MPTAHTSNFPVPSITLEPDIKKGVSFFALTEVKSSFNFWKSDFKIKSDSPVTEDSSILILFPWTKTPSTGMISPKF